MSPAVAIAPRDESIGAALIDAYARLANAGVGTPRLDAELLLAHACGWTRARLLAALREPVPSSAVGVFAAAIDRRLAREPLAYIVGRQEFWSLDFEVTPAVLIPRPETELLVECGLSWLASTSRLRIADVGTGSGCIAIALAREMKSASVWATDLSTEALAVARRNAQRLGVADRICFGAGDLLAPIADGAPFDLICSNPPYVASADAHSLEPELLHEPGFALFAGDDGLAVIRRLLVESPAYLALDGALVMEIGFGQAAAVRGLAQAAGFARVDVRGDYAGIPRVAVASRVQ